MPDTVQHLLGQLADSRFPLRKLLGVSPNSAVFLTSLEPLRHTEPPPDAAIKLIPEDPANSDVQLERWCGAAALSHPGLLKILHYGRCVIDGSPCLYVVTELADEDLGQLLPQRALTPDEARGMLAPVLAALDFLHENGLVHGGVKPSNIHAIGNDVKLSSDRILSAGESSSAWPLAAPFAAPESVQIAASDLWSLGFSLCETLTQNLPSQDASGQLALPELPAPFAEIVRGALVEEPSLRITLDSVRSLLDPTFVPKRKPAPVSSPRPAPEDIIAAVHATSAPAAAQASAAAASGTSSRTTQRAPLPQIDPLSVPLSPVEPPAKSPAKSAVLPAPSRAPIPVSSLPQVKATIAGPRRPISPNPSSSRSNNLFLVAGAAAILLAILFVPRMLFRSSKPTAPASDSSSTPAPANPGSAGQASQQSGKTATRPSSNSAVVTHQPASIPVPSPGQTPVQSLAAPASKSAGSASSSSASGVPSAQPNAASATPTPPSAPAALTVIRKILPEVSEKARATINGTVRINVRVQLNPDGTVASAELANPAASQFFSALALKAAQQWQFGPPAASSAPNDDGALPSSALIRFDFTQISTSAYLP